MKQFTCHICGEQFRHHPSMALSMIGFIWNPAVFDAPGGSYPLCPACKRLFIEAYKALKDGRHAEIEEQKAATWTVRLFATASCREPVAAGGSTWSNPGWNYSQNELEHPARIHRSREQQKVWRF